MEIKLLKLWIGSLKAYRPGIAPESNHFDDLIRWLENYIEESRLTSDCTRLEYKRVNRSS